MNRQRTEELWAGFILAEELSAEEERELIETLAEDAELMERLLADERLDGTLTAMSRSQQDATVFTRMFRDRLSAERDLPRFVRSVRQRLRGSRRERSRRASSSRRATALWPAVALAAGVLMIAFVLPSRSPTSHAPRARPVRAPVSGPHAEAQPPESQRRIGQDDGTPTALRREPESFAETSRHKASVPRAGARFPKDPEVAAEMPPTIPPLADRPASKVARSAASEVEARPAGVSTPSKRTPTRGSGDSFTAKALARVGTVQGVVMFARGAHGPWMRAVNGVPLLAGDRLDTRTGRAVLHLGAARIHANRKTVFRLFAAHTRERSAVLIDVDRGEVYVRDRGERVHVRTADGLISPVGTRFDVQRRLSRTVVTVESGAVDIGSSPSTAPRTPPARDGRPVDLSLWRAVAKLVRIEAGRQSRMRRGARPSVPVRVDVARVVSWARAEAAQGLVALYRFDELRGATLPDESGVGKPLHLKINRLDVVRGVAGGLAIDAPVIIASTGPAAKLTRACKKSNEITVEVWLTPANLTQAGPARIVTVSSNLHDRNFILGQGETGHPPTVYAVRMRTTRDLKGYPSLVTAPEVVRIERTHLVYVRNAAGNETLYVNARVTAQATRGGDFSNWDESYPLTVANVLPGERPWLGVYHHLALYSRSLTAEEVTEHYRAGVP